MTTDPLVVLALEQALKGMEEVAKAIQDHDERLARLEQHVVANSPQPNKCAPELLPMRVSFWSDRPISGYESP